MSSDDELKPEEQPIIVMPPLEGDPLDPAAWAVPVPPPIELPPTRLILNDQNNQPVLAIGLDGLVEELVPNPDAVIAGFRQSDAIVYMVAWNLLLQRRIEALEAQTMHPWKPIKTD